MAFILEWIVEERNQKPVIANPGRELSMSTLGGLLIKKSILTSDQLARAKNDQQQQGRKTK